MTTDIRDTIEKVMNDSYNQGLDHAIEVVKWYNDGTNGVVLESVIAALIKIKKSPKPTPQRVTEQP